MNWREFWNRDNSIYVNERHRTLHYDGIARGIAALVEQPDWVVLDHGSGEAAAADIVARRCARLYLYDSAPNVQARQRLKFSRNQRITVLDGDALDALPDGSLDLVVANSLIQYLGREEFGGLLTFWRTRLRPGGKLVVADVIPPDNDAVGDISALMRFALRGGFFLAACGGLVATFFSDYRKLRTQIGLARYSEDEMRAILAAHGFVEIARSDANIGHNQSRMLFEARAPRA